MSESQVPEMEPLQIEIDAQKPKKEVVINQDDTKHTIRKKVWEHLMHNKLVNFPKPYGRIPNFQGVKEASLRLLELPAFKIAKSVEVLTDKPLAFVREFALLNDKELYVPFSRYQKCLMKKLQLDEKLDVKMVVSRWGIQYTGIKIDIKDEIAIDMIILGSVAVSTKGYRIGKGGGFDDLEFAVFKEFKSITDNTLIVTVVHDSQVFEEFPTHLFKKYDIPVDFIITPTRTIQVEKKLAKPDGIIWNELTFGQVKSRKIFQSLKQKHESEGRDTTLCVLNPENRRVRRPFYWRNFHKRTFTNNVKNDEQNKSDASNHQQRSKVVKFQEPIEVSNEVGATENSENIPPKNKKKKKKQHIDYSLRVGNINRNVRAKEFKQALKDKGIKPTNITWKGHKGFCFLHYAKKNNKEENNDSCSINNIIEIIQELKINPSRPERSLSVKVMEPITRIETVDVTAV